MPKRTFQTFDFEGKTYRIVGRVAHEREYGYTEPATVHYNVLEVRLTNWFAILFNGGRWKAVERERVPTHAWISSATLGDTGGWCSALHAKCRATMGAP